MARDRYHQPIREALELAGWLVKDDHRLRFGGRLLFIDLGAELITAEFEHIAIAVEVKDFMRSDADVIYAAVGQYLAYKSWLARVEPHRILYLGVSEVIANNLFRTDLMQALIEDYAIRILAVSIPERRITAWH